VQGRSACRLSADYGDQAIIESKVRRARYDSPKSRLSVDFLSLRVPNISGKILTKEDNRVKSLGKDAVFSV
jgi:hypothetical protein